jgi:hypothetical protein
MTPPIAPLVIVSLLAIPSLTQAQCPDRATRDSVVWVGSDRVLLRVGDVWRDFRPGGYRSPDLGSDLMVALSLRDPDNGKVRLDGRVTHVWVRRDTTWTPLSVDSAWVTLDTLQVRQAGRGGPTWPVDALVDVAVEWSVGALTYCTAFPRLPIMRTM